MSLPMTTDELKHMSHFYEKLGLPGCAGSADCVYLFLDKCPAPLVRLQLMGGAYYALQA
jgi:hypothetical protein